MLKQVAVLVSILAVLFISPQRVDAVYNQCELHCRVAGSSATLNAGSVLIEKPASYNDNRTSVLKNYLDQFDSPLAIHADAFIKSADRYNLDWKLIPAISGAESTFGKRVAFDSHNPFGYAGGYFSFESWEKAIEVEAEMLAVKYRDSWGLVTPEEIMPTYAPPSKTWAKNVRFFMNDIAQFESNANKLALNL